MKKRRKGTLVGWRQGLIQSISRVPYDGQLRSYDPFTLITQLGLAFETFFDLFLLLPAFMANHEQRPLPPAQYEVGPVRFNDSEDDFFQHPNMQQYPSPPPIPPDDGRKTNNDKSSILTGWTSGITVPLHEPLDDAGQTHAQAIINEYSTRGSRIEGSGSTSNNTPRPHTADKRPQSTHMSIGPDSAGISYIDENFRYYSSRGTPTPNMNRHSRVDSPNDAHDAPLVSNAADMHGTRRRDLEYADPNNMNNKGGIFGRWVDRDRDPIEQRIERRKRGIGRQSRPYVVWILTVIMVALMIFELVKNYQVTGFAFAKPASNPMIGPQSIELVSLGARFPPCMKFVTDVPPTFQINCANASDTNPLPSQICSIEDICGFGGFPTDTATGLKQPNQWFRFITPIFLHAGIIHLLLNMFAQVILSGQVEKEMGSVGFIILYFAAGIFGNVLGGNFALVGRPSVGASGAIVGTLAVLWVDLMAHWKLEYKPWIKLIGHIVNLILVVGLGYVPGVDNFSHLGGFLMGLICGIILLPIISTTKTHRTIVWVLRIAMIPVAIVLFVVLIRNFYTGDPSQACSWCRYLSCIPTASNSCSGTGLTVTTVSN